MPKKVVETTYACDVCGTPYNDTEGAGACEQVHKLMEPLIKRKLELEHDLEAVQKNCPHPKKKLLKEYTEKNQIDAWETWHEYSCPTCQRNWKERIYVSW